MKTPRIDVNSLNSGRDHLRAVVANVDHELSILSGEMTPDDPHAKAEKRLSSSWAELVELLALGPTPKLRVCPICGHTGMRDAIRCGYCWTALPPVAASTAHP